MSLSERQPAPALPVGPQSSRARVLALSAVDKVAPLIILILIGSLMEALHPGFLSIANISTIVIQASVRAILAMGVLLVIISGGIDLSVGTVMSLSMVTMAIFTLNIGMPWLVGLAAAIATGALAGSVNGFLIAFAGLPPFIATLGMMGIAQGIALTMSNGRSMYGLPPVFEWIGGGGVLGIPVPIIVLAAVTLMMGWTLRETRLGRYAFALGGNEESVRRAGIDVRLFKVGIYSACGAISGLASIVLAARINSAHPGVGFGYELDAIAAVVIGGASLMGGRGTIMGALVGALIMATIRFGLNVLGMSPFIQQIVVGCILISAVYLDIVRVRHEAQLSKYRARH